MLTNFFRIIEDEKTGGTIYRGLQSILTITVETKRSIVEDLSVC